MLHLDTSIIIALVVAVPVICLICLYILEIKYSLYTDMMI